MVINRNSILKRGQTILGGENFLLVFFCFSRDISPIPTHTLYSLLSTLSLLAFSLLSLSQRLLCVVLIFLFIYLKNNKGGTM